MLFGFASLIPQKVNAQAWSIKIDPEQDRDSLFIMLSDTVYSKYRHGKFKSVNVNDDHARVTMSGYKEYVAFFTQSSTTAPVATVVLNTLGDSLVWTYTGVGVYTGTLSGAFLSGKVHGDSGFIDVAASGDNTYSIQRATDNTVLLKTYSDPGTTAANAMLTAKPIRFRVYN